MDGKDDTVAEKPSTDDKESNPQTETSAEVGPNEVSNSTVQSS